ncbi:MAG: hypothetical protein ACR2LC_01580 [Pyrinomonadaceae bacterium]
MAKSKASSIGCLFFLLCFAASVILFRQSNPLFHSLATILFIIFLIGVLIFGIIGMIPKKCEVCGNQIKRQSYGWTIGNEQKRVCPHCNRTLERKQSQKATRQFK